GISIPPVLSIRDQWQQRDAFLAQARPLEREYEALSARFPETPIPSREMQLVVQTYDTIARQVHSPVDALNMISRALAESSGLQLTGITWELIEKPGSSGSDTASSRETPPVQGITGLVLTDRSAIRVRIDGEA